MTKRTVSIVNTNYMIRTRRMKFVIVKIVLKIILIPNNKEEVMDEEQKEEEKE